MFVDRSGWKSSFSKMVLLSIEYSYIRNVDLSVIKEITCSVLNISKVNKTVKETIFNDYL